MTRQRFSRMIGQRFPRALPLATGVLLISCLVGGSLVRAAAPQTPAVAPATVAAEATGPSSSKDAPPFAQQLAAAQAQLKEHGAELEEEIRVVSERLKGVEDELRDERTPDRIAKYDRLIRQRDDLQAELEQLRTLVTVYQGANDTYVAGKRAKKELKDFNEDRDRGTLRFRPGETAVLDASLQRELITQKVQQEQEAIRQRRLEEVENELRKPDVKRASVLEQERRTLLAYRETQELRLDTAKASLALWQAKRAAAQTLAEAAAVSQPVTQSQSSTAESAATAREADNKRKLAEALALEARDQYSYAVQQRTEYQKQRDDAVRAGRDTTELEYQIQYWKEKEDYERRQTRKAISKKQEAQLKQQVVDLEGRIQQANVAMENTRSSLSNFTKEERSKLAATYRSSAADMVKDAAQIETDARARLSWVGPTEAMLPIFDAGQEALEKQLKSNQVYGDYVKLYDHYRAMKALYDTERQQIDQMVTTQTVIYYQNLRLATLKRKLADVYVQTAEVLVPSQPTFFDRYKKLFRAIGIFIGMIAAVYVTKAAAWFIELVAAWVKALWPTSTFSVKRVSTLASFAASISRLFIWIFGVITILYEFGIDPATSSGAIGLVGLIMAGMFQQIVVDFIKGLDIIAGRHYNVGDFVELDEKFGHVIDFDVKYTRIRTVSGEELNIPNSRCIPSRRFPDGYVDSYVDIVLKTGADVSEAKAAIHPVCIYLNRRLEPIKERPQFIDRFRAVGGRAILRYRVRVLPGCDWVITDQFINSVKAVLEARGIEMAGEPKHFVINRIETFRKLFSRQLTEQEILQEAADLDAPTADHSASDGDGQHPVRDDKPPVPHDEHGASDKPPPPPDGNGHVDKPSHSREPATGRSE